MSTDTRIWNTLAALPLRFQEDTVWRVGLRPVDVPMFLAALDAEGAGQSSSGPLWHAGVADGRTTSYGSPAK